PFESAIMPHTLPDISQCIRQNLEQYFKDLNGTEPCGVYDMVLHQVEKTAAGVRDGAMRRQPVQSLRDAGAEPQYPA
ncbi:hypothetical protein NEISICOT_03717, partial [Neisseria sicca ATCC 29256]